MKRILTLLIFTTLTGLYAVEGKITYLSGSAEVKSGGKSAPVKLGTTLKEGDTLSTSGNTKVGVQMSDGASFFVSQRTTLEIKPGSAYYQTDGTVSMIFRKEGKHAGGKWSIKTPVVTAGVRGTAFTVEAAKSSARIVLFTGKVIMTDFVRESGLQSDPNLMMQDFLNDIEINSGTALKYNGSDVKKEQVDLSKEPTKKLYDEHQQLEKSEAWKKAARELK